MIGPTAAEDKLTEEDRARGLEVMDPRWGYRAIVDHSRGLVQPMNFDNSACEELRNRFEIKPYDVMLLTYPKTGTIWMQQIVSLLLRGSDSQVNSIQDFKWPEWHASGSQNGINPMREKLLGIDDMMNLPAPTEELSGLRGWKTHSTLNDVPWKGGIEQAAEVGAKIVLVSRNPKDTCISKYHHTKKIPTICFDGDLDAFIPLFLAGRVSHGSFWDWHRDWWVAKEKYPETVLWLHYEDMKKDLGKEIRRVSDFLKLERNDDELDKVTERCTFNAMKKETDSRGGFAAKKNHLRSGKAGGWVDAMSPEIIEAFDAKTEKLYSDCGLRFDDK